MTLWYTGLLLWGSEAAYPLIHSSCGCIPGLMLPTCARITLGFHQSPGRGTDCPWCQAKSALWDFCGLRAGHQGSRFTVRTGSRYVGPPAPPPRRRWQPAEWRRRRQLWAVPGFGFLYTQYVYAHMQYVQPEYTAFCSTDHTFACHCSAYK